MCKHLVEDSPGSIHKGGARFFLSLNDSEIVSLDATESVELWVIFY